MCLNRFGTALGMDRRGRARETAKSSGSSSCAPQPLASRPLPLPLPQPKPKPAADTVLRPPKLPTDEEKKEEDKESE